MAQSPVPPDRPLDNVVTSRFGSLGVCTAASQPNSASSRSSVAAERSACGKPLDRELGGCGYLCFACWRSRCRWRSELATFSRDHDALQVLEVTRGWDGVEEKRLIHETEMKLGWPVLLVFVESVWKKLQVWIRTCVAIAGIIADALHESDFGAVHVG